MLVCQQAINLVGGAATAATANKCHRSIHDDPNEYGSCPSPAFVESLETLGTGGQASKALQEYTISARHEPSALKRTMSCPPDKTTDMGGGLEGKLENDGEKCMMMMSGLSIAIANEMKEEEYPGEEMMLNHHTIPFGGQDEQVEKEVYICQVGSPVTRAAFHSPPPLFANINERANLPGMAVDQETLLDTLKKSPFLVPSPPSNSKARILNYKISNISEVVSSHTVSPLLERCTKEGRLKLKMSKSPPRKESFTGGSGCRIPLNDRLSDFRSFSASF